MGKTIDLTGQSFGRLTVIEFVGFATDRQARWNCKCQCGVFSVVAGGHLRSGHTTSCGCWSKEHLSGCSITHGMSYTATFNIWKGMLTRCGNKNNPAYKNYGGRGITVCDEWKSFERFLSDMGERPEGMSLDRIDNNKGYEPSNCKWSTRSEQARNRRTNIWLTADGKTLLATDWARKLGTSQSTITDRIAKGWSAELACTTPPRSRDEYVSFRNIATRAKECST